jgi:hypothetical protein
VIANAMREISGKTNESTTKNEYRKQVRSFEFWHALGGGLRILAGD